MSLSQPSAVSAPPFTWRLSEAITPIGWPLKRTKPVTWSVPHSGPISKNEPRVGHQPDGAAHVERRGALARDEREQLLLAAVGRIVGVGASTGGAS